jgi:hypothetical protein
MVFDIENECKYFNNSKFINIRFTEEWMNDIA